MSHQQLFRPYLPDAHFPCQNTFRWTKAFFERLGDQSFIDSKWPNTRANISTIPVITNGAFFDTALRELIVDVGVFAL